MLAQTRAVLLQLQLFASRLSPYGIVLIAGFLANQENGICLFPFTFGHPKNLQQSRSDVSPDYSCRVGQARVSRWQVVAIRLTHGRRFGFSINQRAPTRQVNAACSSSLTNSFKFVDLNGMSQFPRPRRRRNSAFSQVFGPVCFRQTLAKCAYFC